MAHRGGRTRVLIKESYLQLLPWAWTWMQCRWTSFAFGHRLWLWWRYISSPTLLIISFWSGNWISAVVDNANRWCNEEEHVFSNGTIFFVIYMYHMSVRETYQLGLGSPNWWRRWRGLSWRRHTLLDGCEKNQGWRWHDLCLIERLADKNLWIVGALSLQLWHDGKKYQSRSSLALILDLCCGTTFSNTFGQGFMLTKVLVEAL